MSRRSKRGAWAAAIISAILVALVAAGGFFDRDPWNYYPARRPAAPIVAVNFSGDMGLRFLMGASTSRGLTARGIPVLGVSTPAVFRRRRTRGEVDALVATAIRRALAQSGAPRVLVMGQSYGADVVQTGLADLPAALRPHVAGIVLVLPGETVFFRADPSGIAYRGTPDSIATRTADTLRWAPLTCIYGMEETDSLCPRLQVPGARIIAMPGGHTLDHDADGLLAHVLAAARAALPPQDRHFIHGNDQ